MEKRDFSVKKLSVTILILLCGLLVLCNKTAKLIENGEVHLQLGDYQRARENFGAAVDLEPTLASARIGLGKAFLQQFTAYPADSTLLIQCLTQLEAARTLKQDKEIEKLLSIVWFKRAKMNLAHKDTVSALQTLVRATSLDPQSTGPLSLAGILYFYRGETDRALNLFRKVISLDSSAASGYFNTGMIYWADSNYTQAYENWFQAARRSPDDREILIWAARAKERCSGRLP